MGFLVVFLRLLVMAFYVVLLGRVLWSWIDPTYRGTVGRFLFETTEPILAPVRRVLPQAGPFDLSPLVVLIGLSLLVGALGLS